MISSKTIGKGLFYLANSALILFYAGCGNFGLDDKNVNLYLKKMDSLSEDIRSTAATGNFTGANANEIQYDLKQQDIVLSAAKSYIKDPLNSISQKKINEVKKIEAEHEALDDSVNYFIISQSRGL